MNEEERATRIEEGIELLGEHLGTVEETAKAFLPSLKGFRRDLALAVGDNPKYISADFSGIEKLVGVPPLANGRSFSDLHKMLALCEEALDGKILLKNPPFGPDQEAREKLLEEVDMVHKNLVEVSDTAYRLYQRTETAVFEFDVFNSKNIDANFPEGNIMFDRDALNLCMVTARAITERAVRIDIDLVEARMRLVSGQKQERA